ncbi:MAG: response regulator [Usitatibacteraceae bacterium]
MTRARILIAEDEPAIAMSLEFLLRKDGYDTFVASDGDAALRMADQLQPDLIVLDLMLPRLNGLEVCRRLRIKGQPRAKVLMLTARGGAADYARGDAVGADAYQVKPFSTQELLEQVRRLLLEGAVTHAN